MTKGNQEPCSGKFRWIWGIPCSHMIEEKLNKFKSMEAPFKLSDVHHQWHLIVPSAMKKKTKDINTEELAKKEFESFKSFFKQLPAFRRRELIGDFYKMCNGYYRLEPAGVVPNPRGRRAMQFPGAKKTLTPRDLSCFQHERRKPKKAPLLSAPVKDLYQSPYLRDALIASPSFQSRGKKEEDQMYAASGSKQDISRVEYLRKEHQKATKLKDEAAERLKHDLFDLTSRKASILRRTSVTESPLPTRMSSKSAGSTTDKRKISPTTYETVTQGSSIKPRTEHEEFMRRISTPELIRKHISAELKKDKKIYEMIEGRNIDEDIRNVQAGKSAGVPTNCSYSGYPPFCMAFVYSNHYVGLHFKKIDGAMPTPPIHGWWLRKCSSRNKNLWL
ncbi:hypothetical protein PPACK8108_LOCUS1512 [Phakopsora pachyrhizi]|uniref:Uncharacterized protein n=1 Tax=Phakopsora pachyrhizi TaxID=170000 RepID=A0AAV0AHQ0_PHAPC|nr:hypothetical protein PPACK8108_LOCUS1512 [Phakopsora pachyrhizi]